MAKKVFIFSEKEKKSILKEYLVNNKLIKDIRTEFNCTYIPVVSFSSLLSQWQGDRGLMNEVLNVKITKYNGFKNSIILGSKADSYFENELEYGAYPLHKLEDLIQEVHGND